MAKHGIKISIIIVWLALMGWWWAESRTWPAPEKIDAAFLPDYNDYFSLNYKDQKIGWSYKSLRRLPGGEYQANHGMTVKFNINGEILEIKNSVLVNMDKSLNLTGFTYLIQAGPVTISESGEAAGGKLSLGINLGEYEPYLERILSEYKEFAGDLYIPIDFKKNVVLNPPDGPGLTQLLPPYISYLGIEKERNYSFKIIDPAGRRLTTVSARILGEGREYDFELGREAPAYNLHLTDELGIGTEIWIDRFGRVYREKSSDFSLVRVDSMTEAGSGIEPLTPPDYFKRFLNSKAFNDLVERGEKLSGKGEESTPMPDDKPVGAPNN